MGINWFILELQSGYVDRVKATVKERLCKVVLDVFLVEILIRKEEVVEMINGSR